MTDGPGAARSASSRDHPPNVAGVPDDPHWIDLCDPDEATLRNVLPAHLHDVTLERLRQRPERDDEVRPRLEARVDYVFGILVFPTLPNDGPAVFQEVDVVATVDMIVTVRKTPPGHEPVSFDEARNTALRAGASPGMCLYALMDEIAEHFLDVVDCFDDAIDELEDHVTDWPSSQIRKEIGSLRHDILHVRRVLAPTRDAARAVLDDRVELDGDVTLFPRDVELHFADAYDKLLRSD